MSHLNNDLRADFVEALEEISTLMSIAYDQLGPVPEDHALAQAGLENGGEIVLDYVDHNEAGVAFEHLLYMINEPPLVVSDREVLEDAIHEVTKIYPPEGQLWVDYGPRDRQRSAKSGVRSTTFQPKSGNFPIYES